MLLLLKSVSCMVLKFIIRHRETVTKLRLCLAGPTMFMLCLPCVLIDNGLPFRET